MWWWWIGVALASPPNKAPASFSLSSSGDVDRLAASSDGRVVVGTYAGGSTVGVLDTESWTLETLSVCGANAATVIAEDSEGDSDTLLDTYTIYIACDDGEVRVYEWVDDALSEVIDEDAEADDDTTDTDSDTSDVPLTFDAGTEDLIAIYPWFVNSTDTSGTPDGLLLVEETETLPTNHTVNLVSETVTGLTARFAHDGLVDGAIDVANRLFVVHDNDRFSTMLQNAVTPITSTTITAMSDIRDVAPHASAVGVYAVEDDGDVWQVTSVQANSTSAAIRFGDIGSVDAVASLFESESLWLVATVGTTVSVYDDSGVAGTTTAEEEFDADWSTNDLLVVDDTITIAGTTDGALGVLTAAPWIDTVSYTPTTAVVGDEITVNFDVDEAGDWEIRRGGNLQTAGDDLDVTGSTTDADSVSTTFTVVDDDGWDEGTNQLWITHTDAAGNVGRYRLAIDVDSPPPQISLDSNALGFGDQELVLTFTEPDVDDIDHYEVYVTTTEFSGSDYDSGGPAFDGTDDITNPLEFDPEEPGASISYTIEPLTNEVTYYVAVRAVDQSDQEGTLSNVLSETPRPTFNAAESAGEPGGFQCGCASDGATRPLSLGAAALGAAALFGRRRRNWLAAGLVVLLMPGWAEAQERSRRVLSFQKDDTPAWGNFEIRYGIMNLDDADIDAVYGDAFNDIMFAEFGPQLGRVVEVDLGFGWFGSKGRTVDASGVSSSTKTRLRFHPLTADVTLRADFVDEQPFVPFARAGGDLLVWRERTLDSDGKTDSSIGGAKVGWHWAAGGQILLDIFGPNRASRLETQTGINDTWLTIEYRNQQIGQNTNGLDFSGWSITAGIKLDY